MQNEVSGPRRYTNRVRSVQMEKRLANALSRNIWSSYFKNPTSGTDTGESIAPGLCLLLTTTASRLELILGKEMQRSSK